MASISNDNSIVIVRGDTFKAPLFINIGTDDAPVRLDFNKFKDIEIILQLITKYPSHVEVFSKKFTYEDANEYGDVVLTLEPSETRPIISGRYDYVVTGTMYDAELSKVWMYTIVPPTTITII